MRKPTIPDDSWGFPRERCWVIEGPWTPCCGGWSQAAANWASLSWTSAVELGLASSQRQASRCFHEHMSFASTTHQIHCVKLTALYLLIEALVWNTELEWWEDILHLRTGCCPVSVGISGERPEIPSIVVTCELNIGSSDFLWSSPLIN